MIDLAKSYAGKRVFVTGSAGFKGRHLVERLLALGAKVKGFDLVRGTGGAQWPEDVRHGAYLRDAIARVEPDVVFHLAAQAFVPLGYENPRLTWETNVDGTINALEALRQLGRPCAVVVVTTDKVFGATETPAVETDRLFGRCPYSASKVAAELAVESYRESYFAPKGHRIAVATARAGNVIGPGDAGPGRLVPNALAALRAGSPIPVYHPEAVRPWQYVDDVIDGYLRLGAALSKVSNGEVPAEYVCAAWNFGPAFHHTVVAVVEALISAWGSGTWEHVKRDLHEVDELRIDSTKARRFLGWEPQWTLTQAAQAIVRVGR